MQVDFTLFVLIEEGIWHYEYFVLIEEDICCYVYYYLHKLGSSPHPIHPGNKICNCALRLTHEGVWSGLLTAVALG